MIWGISNDDHAIVGTNFYSNMEIKNEPLKHYLVSPFSENVTTSFFENVTSVMASCIVTTRRSFYYAKRQEISVEVITAETT